MTSKMEFNRNVLKNEEKAIFDLRALYSLYGYTQYKMSKFEAYDLYVRNKDYLVSDNIITFTDTDGKLLALKPDVTLSIIKNGKDVPGSVQKVYYNENVYRVSKKNNAFQEIMQVGLECIGAVDDYCIFETVMLAAQSLQSISKDYILDVSHMDIVSEAIEAAGVGAEEKKALLERIGEKNLHGIDQICSEAGVDGTLLKTLASTYGKLADVLPKLETISISEKMRAAIEQLTRMAAFLDANGCADNVYIDFSVINNQSYYNGIVFCGFIKGIPTGILSGGEYDKLMQKMGRKSHAIGFAVYLDMLERLQAEEKKYDVDAVILYDAGADVQSISAAVKLMTAGGKRVLATGAIPEKLQYKQLLKLQEKGLEILENNA